MSTTPVAPTQMNELGSDALARVGQLGRSMQRLTIQRQSARMDLNNSGLLKPATIFNFNPVKLHVPDANVPCDIPSIIDKHKKSVKFLHNGREYTGAYVTIREPKFIPWPRDAKKPENADENVEVEYDAKHLLPIELADTFRHFYQNPQHLMMGGVLTIEGDVHSFISKAGLSKTVRVPKFTVRPDRARSYFSEEVELLPYLTSVLDTQKNFCEMMIQQADGYNQDDEQRPNITTVHRLWAQFALDMGFKEVSPEWMTAKLDSDVTCKGCGKAKTRNDAFFCGCGRPFNPKAAFLAGENVPEAYLLSLHGDDLKEVLAEMDRREKIKEQFRKKSS